MDVHSRDLNVDVKAMTSWLKKAIKLKGFTAEEKWTDEHESMAIQFLTLPEIKKLVAYMSSEGELMLLTPYAGLPVAPRAFAYFVKKVDHAHISADNIKSALQFGVVNGGGIESMMRLMDSVYLPVLKESGSWPDSVRKDMVGQAQRFMASLVETSHQIKGKTVLYVPPEPIPADVKEGAKDKDLLQRLEATVIHWTRQIKEVVSNQDTSASSAEAGGPLEEIGFYSSRCQDLSGITDQLNAPPLQQIVATLREANSSYLGPFETLAQSIQRGSDEAADNLRFLLILKPSCEALSIAHPTEVPAILPEILNRIRVIGAVSRFYHTEERLTSLLRKISNEVIKRCCAVIDVPAAFDGDVSSVMATLDQCIACCQAWRAIYDDTVAAVAAHPGKRGLLWRFDVTSIFAQTEAFMQRCRDLGEVCEGQVQFARKSIPGSGAQAPLPAFGGSRGGDIARSLVTIEESFGGHLSALRDLQNDVLDVKAVRWTEANARFKAGMKDLETMMGNVINDAFLGVASIPSCIELLEAFSSLAKRPAVQRAVDKKTVDVYTLFSKQVGDIKQYFDSNASSPPLGTLEPKFAGAALWARSLQAGAESDWKLLSKAAHYLTPCKAAAEAADSYEKLSAGLDEFMRGRYSEWMRTLNDLDAVKLTERLAISLFTRASSMVAPVSSAASSSKDGKDKASSSSKEGKQASDSKHHHHDDAPAKYLASNFDHAVLSLLTEVACWERFEGKFLIPFFATDLAHEHTDPLRILRQHVLLACNDYNTIVSSMDEVEARLFADVIKRLDRKIAPGLAKMTWGTKNVSGGCSSTCSAAVAALL